jgi:hypothetical protein
MSSTDVEDEATDCAGSLPSWNVDLPSGSEHQSSGTLESWTEEEHAADVILNLRLPERDTKHLIDEGALYRDLERIGAGTDDEFVDGLSETAVETIKAWHGREQKLIGAKFMDAAWAAQVATPGPRVRPSGQLPDEVVAAVVGGGSAAAAPAATAEEGVPPASSSESTTWSCGACTLQNTGDVTTCAVCGTPRGASEPVDPVSRDAARADAATMQAIEAAVASSEFPSEDAF